MVGEETGDHTDLLQGDSTAFVTVIYNNPEGSDGVRDRTTRRPTFPWWYREPERSRFTRAELTKYSKNLDGSAPSLYRQAKLYFPNADALKKGTGTAAFKAVADDLPKFADGGLVALGGASDQ